MYTSTCCSQVKCDGFVPLRACDQAREFTTSSLLLCIVNLLLILFCEVAWGKSLPLAAAATPNGMFYARKPEERVFDGCSFGLKGSGADMPVNTGLPAPRLNMNRLVSAEFFREEKRRREESLGVLYSFSKTCTFKTHFGLFLAAESAYCKYELWLGFKLLRLVFLMLKFWMIHVPSGLSRSAVMTGFWAVQPKNESLKHNLDACANSCLLSGCKSKRLWWSHCDLQFVLEVSPFVQLCFARCFSECLQLSSPSFLPSFPSDTNKKTLQRRERLLWALSALHSPAYDTVG